MDIEYRQPNPHDGSLRVVVRISDEWRAYLRFAPRPGYPLAELTVFPVEDTDPRDILEDGVHYDDESVPPKGLAIRPVRDLNIDEIRDQLRDLLEDLEAETDDESVWAPLLERFGDPLSQETELDTRERYALLAAEYDELVRRGENPNTVMADRHGVSRSKMTQRIYRARHVYDFLTVTEQGVAGGRLTAKGRQVLERLAQRSQLPPHEPSVSEREGQAARQRLRAAHAAADEHEQTEEPTKEREEVRS